MPTKAGTPSPATANPTSTAEQPDPRTLRRLKISPEVGYYLTSRGITLPESPPTFKTPEPRTARGARFDPDRVDRVLRAFGLLRHTQGRWAGKPLVPDPWQIAYILAPVFGWVRADPDSGHIVRIVNSLYVEVPRRNGKTTLSGGIAIYLTCADGEPGAQVIAAATQERQARFLFDPVRQLAQRSPALKPYVLARSNRILHSSTGSYFEVISSVAEAQHGANLHGAIVDELHVHKSPELVETLETGTGSRTQPLVVIITTADDGRMDTIYARKRERIEKLARRVLKDESSFGVIWAANESDDPYAEATWRRANPGYGVSPTRSYLRRAAKEAEQSPADLAKFLRLHLGIRTKQDARYIDLKVWDRNAGKRIGQTELAGRECYGGLDLAATSDLSALCWVFPNLDQDGRPDGSFDVLWRHWAPEAALAKLDERTAGLASVWVRDGLLDLTPGEVCDYDHIRAAINLDRERFDVRQLAFDPWNSTQLVNDLLADGAPMVKMRQGFVSMSPPTKELLRLLLEGTKRRPKLRHGGNPLVRWQADHLGVETDASDNVKPSKKKSSDKIDGIVALIMALDRAINREPIQTSAYEDGDGLTIV